MRLVAISSPKSDSSRVGLKGQTTSFTNSLAESCATNEDINPRLIWRKVDLHILPWISMLFLMSYLDRVNIGNAKVAGMSKDLHLVGFRYSIASAVFFITYCMVEVPSNVILKLFPPSKWVPIFMVAWGTIMACMSLVNSFQGLVIARIFLGLAEGSLLPGLIYYISSWYPRQMQAKRISVLAVAACFGGGFGGFLAYGIQHLAGKGGLHGWQWIFLIEGLLTIVIASVSYFFMHDYPDTEMPTFLTEDEWLFVLEALREDYRGQPTYFSVQFIWQALSDWKTHMGAIIYLGTLIPLYAIALFMPTIIHDLGFSASGASLMAAPPFMCAGICTMGVSFLSDKMNLRGPFVILGSTVSMIGYIIADTTSKPGLGYAATFLAASGVHSTSAIILSWAGGNAGGDLKRRVVYGAVIGLGNLGGICASFVYYQPPRFHKGHGTIIGSLVMSIIASAFLMWKCRALNKEREEMCLREGIDHNMTEKYCELGDRSPLFRYVI